MQTFVGCSMFRDLDTLLYMVFRAQAFEFTIWFQPTTFLSLSFFLFISFLLSLTPKIHSEHAYVCGVCMLFLHICVVFPFHFSSVDSSKTQISGRKKNICQPFVCMQKAAIKPTPRETIKMNIKTNYLICIDQYFGVCGKKAAVTACTMISTLNSH